jgi:hypothetical protein
MHKTFLQHKCLLLTSLVKSEVTGAFLYFYVMDMKGGLNTSMGKNKITIEMGYL